MPNIFGIDPKAIGREFGPVLAAEFEKSLERVLSRYMQPLPGTMVFDRQAAATVTTAWTTVLDVELNTAQPGIITGVSCSTTGASTRFRWTVDSRPLFGGAVLDHILTPSVPQLYPVGTIFGISGGRARILCEAFDGVGADVVMRVAGFQTDGNIGAPMPRWR